MAHGLAVSPGSGTDQCGTTSTYYLGYICSSYYTAKFFGLDQARPTDPFGLTVTGTTGTTVSLRWNALSGAASYNVYRDGTLVNASTGTSYTDTGLSAGMTYSYTVAAVDSAGTVGPRSAPVNATTAVTGPCFTDNNYNQTVAGRAHQSGGSVYANGSNQAMGLWTTYTIHTLQETGPDHYVLADGRC